MGSYIKYVQNAYIEFKINWMIHGLSYSFGLIE